jgi:hypothetical protein
VIGTQSISKTGSTIMKMMIVKTTRMILSRQVNKFRMCKRKSLIKLRKVESTLKLL